MLRLSKSNSVGWGSEIERGLRAVVVEIEGGRVREVGKVKAG